MRRTLKIYQEEHYVEKTMALRRFRVLCSDGDGSISRTVISSDRNRSCAFPGLQLGAPVCEEHKRIHSSRPFSVFPKISPPPKAAGCCMIHPAERATKSNPTDNPGRDIYAVVLCPDVSLSVRASGGRAGSG